MLNYISRRYQGQYRHAKGKAKFQTDIESARETMRKKSKFEAFTKMGSDEYGNVDYSPIFRKASVLPTAHIFGALEDDANACDYLLNQVEEKKPRALIMGNFSASDMLYLKVGELSY